MGLITQRRKQALGILSKLIMAILFAIHNLSNLIMVILIILLVILSLAARLITKFAATKTSLAKPKGINESCPKAIAELLPSKPSFHKFDKLPTELRLRVWSFASFEPRFIHIRDIDDIPSATFNTKVPGILHACSESRHEALKFYTLLRLPYVCARLRFHTMQPFPPNKQPRKYVNLEIDTICALAPVYPPHLDARNLDQFFKFCSMKGVKRIAIRADDFSEVIRSAKSLTLESLMTVAKDFRIREVILCEATINPMSDDWLRSLGVKGVVDCRIYSFGCMMGDMIGWRKCLALEKEWGGKIYSALMSCKDTVPLELKLMESRRANFRGRFTEYKDEKWFKQ